MLDRKTVLGAQISTGSYQQFIDEIFFLSSEHTPSYVCFANVHMLMEGYHDPEFMQIVNNANIIAPDGKPVSLFIQYFEDFDQSRICGMDLFPDLLKQAAKKNKSIYLLGNTNEVLQTIKKKAIKDFPTLTICGTYSPPFRALSAEENTNMLQSIKAVNPDLILISLGCPKQERWMAAYKNELGTCLLGVGQAFNTYAGTEKRIAPWMRNLPIEWLYRLVKEPKRLWKRYLITNSLFLLLVIGHASKKITHRLAKSLLA